MLATNCSELIFNIKAQPDPEPSLVMKNHLALDIRVEQLMLLIKAVCGEHLLSAVKGDLPDLCSFSYTAAFSGFGLCMCPTALQ